MKNATLAPIVSLPPDDQVAVARHDNLQRDYKHDPLRAQERFQELYQEMRQTLVLQGKRPKTVDAYSRAVRRIAEYFDRCPDELTTAELKDYFADLLKTHAWSAIKLDRNGLQFFCRHVLDKQWEWLGIIKPPKVQTLPDILSREETL